MTTFFFRRSVEKAFQLDEQPPDLSLNPHKPLNSNPPHITSAVDDIMYIVNKVLQQSLATSQKDVVTNVVPTLGRVLGSDFVGMMQRKMRDESYPKAAIQGALPPEHTIVAFLVLVNNLDVATDYVRRIVRGQVEPSSISQATNGEATSNTPLASLYPLGDDAKRVANILKNLETSFAGKTTELLNDGIHVVFKNVMQPRLRPILLDAFRDVEYQLTEEELVELAREEGREEEDSELVRRRFQHGWDALTKPIARIMTETTFDKLLTIIVSYLSKLLEKRIWGYSGRVNELGAVRLERDVTSIVAIVVQGRRYGFRESFMKCTQICMIMNMEEDEWEEIQGNKAGEVEVADKLTKDERLRARGMIVEDGE